MRRGARGCDGGGTLFRHFVVSLPCVNVALDPCSTVVAVEGTRLVT